MKGIFICVLLFSSKIYSEDYRSDILPSNTVDENFQSLIKLNQFRKKDVQKKLIKKQKLNRKNKEVIKINKQNVVKHFISKNAIIFSLEDNSSYRLSKTILAYTYFTDNNTSMIVVLDKQFKPKYEVDQKFLIESDKILDLYQEPKNFYIEQYETQHMKTIHHFSLKTQFRIGLEKFVPHYLENFENEQNQKGSAYSSKFELYNYFDWDFLLIPGFSIGYSKSIMSYSAESEKTASTYYLGPIIKSMLTKNPNRSFAIYTGYQKSIRHRVESISTSNSFDFSTESILLGLEVNQSKSSDGLVWGIEYNYKRFSYNKYDKNNNSNLNVELATNNQTSHGLGLYLAYEFGIIL